MVGALSTHMAHAPTRRPSARAPHARPCTTYLHPCVPLIFAHAPPARLCICTHPPVRPPACDTPPPHHHTTPQIACERLLNFRVELKVGGRRIGDVLNRIHVAQPKVRDTVARPPVIPPGVAEARAKREAGLARRKLQKEYQEEAGGAGACVRVRVLRQGACVC